MGRTLSEKRVLRKLGIDDFRHLTKDKVMEMASLLDRMDPEVAKKALEQFPDFSNTMREVFAMYKTLLDKAMERSKEGTLSYYATCDAIIASCQSELERENLSFEQRQQIMRCMIDVADMKGVKDTEDKKFLQTLCAYGLTAFGMTATVLLTALGGNAKINLKKS